VRELTCAERESFRLTLCAEDGTPPARPSPSLPTLNPLPPTRLTLAAGVQVEINTIAGLSQRVRVAPGAMTNADILTNLPDGAVVTLTGQRREAVGYVWWEITGEGGLTGWVVEYDPADGVQTLVPVGAVP
jgi:hypothetical protein